MLGCSLRPRPWPKYLGASKFRRSSKYWDAVFDPPLGPNTWGASKYWCASTCLAVVFDAPLGVSTWYASTPCCSAKGRGQDCGDHAWGNEVVPGAII